MSFSVLYTRVRVTVLKGNKRQVRYAETNTCLKSTFFLFYSFAMAR